MSSSHLLFYLEITVLFAATFAYGGVTSNRPTFLPPLYPSIPGKIILEEHATTSLFQPAFTTPIVNGTSEIPFGQPAYRADVAARLNGSNLEQRVADMDSANVSLSIISLVPPGLQGVFDRQRAISLARQVNDEFSATYGSGKYASRFKFFCSLQMQSVPDAIVEMNRCMKLPGAVGLFLSGYTNTVDANTVLYLDDPVYDPFWRAAAALNLPVYLHPRMPAPDQQRVYRDYEFLGGSMMGFSFDISTVAVRLMLAGVFDRHPSLQIVLGHCGEGIPFTLYRMDHRARHMIKTWPGKQTLQYYFENNVLTTTSGVASQSAFWDMMKVMTPDRVMFSADTPFEDIREMSDFLDNLEMNSITKRAIASGNARRWYRLR